MTEVLSELEWKERAVLTLQSLENFNSRQIGYSLSMSSVSAWVLSQRTHQAVRKLLKSNKRPWNTQESFCKSLKEAIESEIKDSLL